MSFSEETVERFRRVAHQGIEPSPQALGMAGSFRKGHFVVIGLHFEQGRIAQAGFRSSNCLPTIVAADWLCEKAEGSTGDRFTGLTVEALAEALGGIPPRKVFCLKLALDAANAAVLDGQKKGFLS